jgi:hypothetical protein
MDRVQYSLVKRETDQVVWAVTSALDGWDLHPEPVEHEATI